MCATQVTSSRQMPQLSSLTGNADADYDLNLGAEPLSSVSELDSWIAPTTNLPTRAREWRSDSYSQKQKDQPSMKKEVDRDCGICFEIARTGCRTPCCRSLFCLEHITQWLNGPSSEGRCPSCGTPCTIKNGCVSIAAAHDLPPQLAPPSSYAPSPLPSPYSGPHETTVDVSPISPMSGRGV